MWNQKNFLNSIEWLVKNKCDGVQKKFNTLIHDRDAISRWKKGDRPSLEILTRIVDEFNCNYDWLLTGKEPLSFSPVDKQNNREYKPSNLPIHDQLEIILNSGKPEAEEVKIAIGRSYDRMHHEEILAEITSTKSKMENMEKMMSELLKLRGNGEMAGTLPKKKRLSNAK